MKILAVLGMLLGFIAVMRHYSDKPRDEALRNTVATNFITYRNAVLNHVRSGGISGEIPLAALELPLGWQPLWNRPWTARVENGRCYIYGSASPAEAMAARDLLRGSFALGMARNGFLAPAPRHGHAIDLPGFIPDGNLVSVTEAH